MVPPALAEVSNRNRVFLPCCPSKPGCCKAHKEVHTLPPTLAAMAEAHTDIFATPRKQNALKACYDIWLITTYQCNEPKDRF